MRISENDDAGIMALHDKLPEGWVLGPLRCPIGGHPQTCSAGYCVECLVELRNWQDHRAARPTPAADGG